MGERRRALGYSQTQLADKLGTTHQTISRWEAGWNTPDLTTLAALAGLLEFSLDELVAS